MKNETSIVESANLLSELQTAIRWLDALDVGYSATRFGRYQKILNQLERARFAGLPLNEAATAIDAFPSLFEANELITIHKGLAGKNLDSYLQPRLEEMVSGPESYVDESTSTSSNKARNTGFELAVIARWAAAGLEIRQDDDLSDVVAHLGNQRVIVECKRPQSEAAIPQAIASARLQLARRYRAREGEGATGFIALDLTKVSNPDLSVTVDIPSNQVVSLIRQRMESVVKKHAPSWNKVKEKQTAGVLLRLSRLAWIKADRTMLWIHKHGITPFVGRCNQRVAVVRAIEEATDRAVIFGKCS